MKADRYLHPDRHLDDDMGFDMNDNLQPPQDTQTPDEHSLVPSEQDGTLQIDVGHAMPPSQVSHLPLLRTEAQGLPPGTPSDAGPDCSVVAEGMHFVGHALLRGPCSVAGQVEGNLTQAPDAVVAVVVTETGRLKGDITAQKISVMGHTDGILDAGQGEVALHDTARVHGLVRYGRIQVNGADLNATLERVAQQKPGA